MDTLTDLFEAVPGIENAAVYSCCFIAVDFHFGSDIPSGKGFHIGFGTDTFSADLIRRAAIVKFLPAADNAELRISGVSCEVELIAEQKEQDSLPGTFRTFVDYDIVKGDHWH